MSRKQEVKDGTVYRIYRDTRLAFPFRYTVKRQEPGDVERYVVIASTRWGARRIVRREKRATEILVEEL